jgi:hypothetical protein
MSQSGVLLALVPNMSPVRRGETLFLAGQERWTEAYMRNGKVDNRTT